MKPVKIQKEIYLDEVLEPSDLKRLLRKAKEKNMMDLYFIMKIYAYTGIRESELKYFTVENLENNVLMISNKGKVRKVIVRNDLMRELRRYAKKNKIESGTLFPGKNGKMLHRTTITRRMKKLAGQCRGINLNKIHPHSFRHLFAIQFLKCGGTLNELQAQLGHSSLNTTSIYTATTVLQRKNSKTMLRLDKGGTIMHEDIYAVYKGEKLIVIGTEKEICRKLHWTRSTFKGRLIRALWPNMVL